MICEGLDLLYVSLPYQGSFDKTKYELCHEKTYFLPMRKQRAVQLRGHHAAQIRAFVFAT